jgi:hypothetical protein
VDNIVMAKILGTQKKTAKKKQARRGRPGPDYNPEYCRIASVACSESGATNLQLAKMFGCCRNTIQNWMREYPDFKAAILDGRDVFNVATAETCLLKRLKGYSYTETVREQAPMLPPALLEGIDDKTAKELFDILNKNLVVTKKTRKHVPSDSTSLLFFLKNRARKRWPDTHNVAGDIHVFGEIDPATKDILDRLKLHDNQETDS